MAAVGRMVGVGVGSSSVMVSVAWPGASVASPETSRSTRFTVRFVWFDVALLMIGTLKLCVVCVELLNVSWPVVVV